MGTFDVYRITNELDSTTLDALTARLEARGKHPRFMQMMRQYLDEMAIDAAGSVLDLGCGTGVASRTIATRPGFAGRVVGIDRSQHLVAEATRLAAEAGLADKVGFLAGDSHSLDLRDEAFDAVVAHTLFSHLEDPSSVLREIARVLKPGGCVGIFDGDYASFTFASNAPDEGKSDDDAIIKAVATNPRVMREMPRLLREAGLEIVAAHPHVVADIGRTDFFGSAIQSFVKLLPRAGVMSTTQAEDWATGMFRRSDDGIFFAACNYYSYVARKDAAP